MSNGAGPQRVGPGLLVLVAMGVSLVVLANDFSALNVSLASIQRSFHAELSTVQWVINAYALVYGMLIVAGGRLADLFGRRQTFLIGAGIFAATSLLAGAAQGEGWLIAARALMGVGGALMFPAIVGMTYEMLPERAGVAGAIVAGASGAGLAIGPLLGGALTDLLTWRWVMFINLPIAAFAMTVTWRRVHLEHASPPAPGIDRLGTMVLSFGLLAALLALDQATDWGWGDPRIIALVALAVALLVLFAVVEHHAGPAALVPPDLVANREFLAACVVMTVTVPTFFVAMLYVPQFLQRLLGASPFTAGLGMLPMMLSYAVFSIPSARLLKRFGAKLVIATGAGCLAIGPLLLSFAGQGSPYLVLVPGLVITGLGLALFFSALTTAAITAVDAERASLAGALIYMFELIGGSVGLALSTAVLTGSANRQSDQAFAAGLQAAFRLDAALALVGALIAVAVVGRRARAVLAT